MHPYSIYVVSLEAIGRKNGLILSLRQFRRLERDMEVRVNFYRETDSSQSLFTGILQVIIPPYLEQPPGGGEVMVVEGEMLECDEVCGIVKLVYYPRFLRMLLLPQ